MTKLPDSQLRTYAKTIKYDRQEHEKIHGLVKAYGGLIKDVAYVMEDDTCIMFYEMGKEQRAEFEKELYAE